jgi:hypothetical protein
MRRHTNAGTADAQERYGRLHDPPAGFIVQRLKGADHR